MKTKQDFKKRKPDYRGKGVAVWLNKKGDQEWLSVKIEGMGKAIVAFKNDRGGE